MTSFMAPELNSGRPFDPMPTDIWSCGATLAELCYGNGTVEVLVGIDVESAPTKLRELQAALVAAAPPWQRDSPEDRDSTLDFLAQTLCAEPRARLTAARALEHPLASGSHEQRGSLAMPQHRPRTGSSSDRPGSRSSSSGSRGPKEPTSPWAVAPSGTYGTPPGRGLSFAGDRPPSSNSGGPLIPRPIQRVSSTGSISPFPAQRDRAHY